MIVENAETTSNYDVMRGVIFALVIVCSALLLSVMTQRRIKVHTPVGHVGSLFACMAFRLFTSLVAVLTVFIVLGPTVGVPCALATIPLYFVEMTCSIWLHLRQNLSKLIE